MKDSELITRKNIELALLNKGQNSRRYRLGDIWELNYDEIREVLDDVDADVQPVTFCKECQWLADIKDVDTGELYHTCGVLAFDVPDGFACNQGKRKGADNVSD